MRNFVIVTMTSLLALPAFAQYESVEQYSQSVRAAQAWEFQDMASGEVYDNDNALDQRALNEELAPPPRPGGGGAGRPAGGRPSGGTARPPNGGGSRPGNVGHPAGQPSRPGNIGRPTAQTPRPGNVGRPTNGGQQRPGQVNRPNGGQQRPGQVNRPNNGGRPGNIGPGRANGGRGEGNRFPGRSQWGHQGNWWRGGYGNDWHNRYSWWPGFLWYAGACFAEDNSGILFSGPGSGGAELNCRMNSPSQGCSFVGCD